MQKGMGERKVSCKTLTCLFSVSNSLLSFLRVYKAPPDPLLCSFLPKEKIEPHSRHMLTARRQGWGGIKMQEARPEEAASFSDGQGLGPGNGRGTKPFHFLPQRLNAG